IGSFAVMAMALTACESGGLAENNDAGSDESGLEVGATKEDYIEAFEDIDPIELNFQYASTNPESFSALRDLEWASTVEEWSGGKITVNTHTSGAIASPTYVPEALSDDCLYVANYFCTYEPQQMVTFFNFTYKLLQMPSTPFY